MNPQRHTFVLLLDFSLYILLYNHELKRVAYLNYDFLFPDDKDEGNEKTFSNASNLSGSWHFYI